ncbi:MAG: Uma2 family endonuclease [Jaaginema sp. PMC 1079.18]|nr:Uma2 family endonuclease [Jaaginema sp. PMC 1080.18]MEC4852823.1 Uma2 family endonuclease [Jaaginema sp. PMC 1079.18]MEC4867874.1 Uma2 family endonuclease [Jaaginema sp. PMC 1078.18]
MTTLQIQGDRVPLRIHFPAIASLTAGQFYEFALANRDLRIERTSTGEVIVMPPAFSDTGNRNLKIVQQLANWADRDGTGEVFDSSAGFTLPNGAVRSPDASWIKRDRWQALSEEEKASFAPICPDFVVELHSRSDRLSQLQAKCCEYIENGVALAWLIDRQNRTVTVYRPQGDSVVLESPEAVCGDPELPGFVLQMARIW